MNASTPAPPTCDKDLRDALEDVWWQLTQKALEHRSNGDQLRFLIYREAASEVFNASLR